MGTFWQAVREDRGLQFGVAGMAFGIGLFALSILGATVFHWWTYC